MAGRRRAAGCRHVGNRRGDPGGHRRLLPLFGGAHSDQTIEALPLETVGEVPWWSAERRRVTLHQILVHVCVEIARHAGHADILRELLDGAIGNGPDDPNIPRRSAAEWSEYRDRLEASARQAQR